MDVFVLIMNYRLTLLPLHPLPFNTYQAVGKNKKQARKGRKKEKDAMLRKEWYVLRAPNMFKVRSLGYSPVNRTAGTHVASEALKGRLFEVNLADMQKDEDQAHRKIKLRVEDVRGTELLTSFAGMDMTVDKLRSLVRRWHSTIEANVDVKTADGFVLRLFAIGFTKRRGNQVKRTTYAAASQIRQCRAKMVSVMQKHASASTIPELVAKFLPGIIGEEMEKECSGIFPLKDVYVRKVKILKRPKADPARLLELHAEVEGAQDATTVTGEDTGTVTERLGEEATPIKAVGA